MKIQRHLLVTVFLSIIIPFIGFSQNKSVENKGSLVPNITTSEINTLESPVEGLRVFDTEKKAYYIYTGSKWKKVSKSNKSEIKVDGVLFEIRDQYDVPVFTITEDGVRFYVKEYSAKGVSGGFAVGQYSSLKGTPDTTLFFVSSDSARIYTKPPSKGVSGGFAVGQYGSLKGNVDTYMHLTDNNYFIGHNAGTSNSTGLYNLFLGYESGMTTNTGSENIFLGYKSGHLNQSGNRNVFLGHASGYNNISGEYNVAIGDSAFYSSQTGHYNVVIGYRAGYTSTNSHNNTFVGAGAGKLSAGLSNTFIGNSSGLYNENGTNNVALGITAGLFSSGDNNVFIGGSAGFGSGGGAGSGNIFIGAKAGYSATGDNQLIIENSNSSTPLLFGNFSTDLVGINDAVPTAYLHIKQVASGEEGLAIENDTGGGSDIWAWEIGTNDLALYYNGVYKGAWDDLDGAYTSVSDKRLKDNIKEVSNVLNKVNKLKVVEYYFKDDNKRDKKSVGLIAQDVEKIFPSIVSKPEEKGNAFYSMNYSGFGVIAIKAIQEQQTQIEALGAENKELRKEIQEIRTLLEKK